MADKKSFRVKDGNRSLWVVPHAKGWRFEYAHQGRRRFVTRRKRVDIVEAAEKVLEEMGTGFVFSALPVEARAAVQRLAELSRGPGDWRAAVDFMEARAGSEPVADAVERWMEAKVMAAGEETPYLRDLRARMRGFAAGMGGRKVADVSFEVLREWVNGRREGRSVKFYIDLRAGLVEFWRWCRREGLTDGHAVTPAERLPVAKRERMERRVATPGELVEVLNEVGAEWRAWVVLGAWAGLRPEELAPKPTRKKKHKRGLHCEDIDWRFNVLRVPPDVSKIGRPRVVPMGETLRTGLEWAGIEPGMTGPVVLRNPTEAKETARLGKLVFGSHWPKDILRHSFGSYRNAELRNLAQVAEEMGTSEAMLHAHYHNPRAEEEAEGWFGVVLESSRWKEVFGESFEDGDGAKLRQAKESA